MGRLAILSLTFPPRAPVPSPMAAAAAAASASGSASGSAVPPQFLRCLVPSPSLESATRAAGRRGFTDARECLAEPFDCRAEDEGLALCYVAALRCDRAGGALRVGGLSDGSVSRLATVLRLGSSPGPVSLLVTDCGALGPLSGAELEAPLSACARLYSVRLGANTYGRATRWWLRLLARAAPPSLRHLELDLGYPGFDGAVERGTEDGANAAFGLPLLESLTVHGAESLSRVSDPGLPSLRRLSLHYGSWTAREPAEVAESTGALLAAVGPHLRQLTVDASRTSLGAAAWRAIAGMALLEDLRLFRVSCRPGEQAAMAAALHPGLARLETLQLLDVGIVGLGGSLDALLRSASALPALGSLTVSHVGVRDMPQLLEGVTAALEQVAARCPLRSLSLEYLAFDQRMLLRLADAVRAHLPGSLEVFSLGGFQVSDSEPLQRRGHDFALPWEGLEGDGRRQVAMLHAPLYLADALGRCPRLRVIRLACSRKLLSGERCDEGFAAMVGRFAELRALEEFGTGTMSCRPREGPELKEAMYPLTRLAAARWQALRDRERRGKASWAIVSEGLRRWQERRALAGGRAPSCRMGLLPACVLRDGIAPFLDEPRARLVFS
jgi:hypothetical protein